MQVNGLTYQFHGKYYGGNANYALSSTLNDFVMWAMHMQLARVRELIRPC